MDNIEIPLIQSVLNSIDEFNAIKLGDLIEKDGVTSKVHGAGLDTLRQSRTISIMRESKLVSISRDTYLFEGWNKVAEKETNEITKYIHAAN